MLLAALGFEGSLDELAMILGLGGLRDVHEDLVEGGLVEAPLDHAQPLLVLHARRQSGGKAAGKRWQSGWEPGQLAAGAIARALRVCICACCHQEGEAEV